MERLAQFIAFQNALTTFAAELADLILLEWRLKEEHVLLWKASKPRAPARRK
jgi:hypothetical protein